MTGGDLDLFQTIIIAIVEGLTEFLPVSSTGHMIIAQNILGVESTEFVKAFTFIIQFGAILSVVCLYWKRFFRLNHTPAPEGASALKRFLHTYDFYWKLFVAFIPAAVLGLLFSDMIDAMLESVTVDGCSGDVDYRRRVYVVLRQAFREWKREDGTDREACLLYRIIPMHFDDTGCLSFDGDYCGRYGTEINTQSRG